MPEASAVHRFKLGRCRAAVHEEPQGVRSFNSTLKYEALVTYVDTPDALYIGELIPIYIFES